MKPTSLLLFAGLLCGTLAVSPAVNSRHTFSSLDATTGKQLVCDMCPPGFHMSAPCTETTPTKCTQCRDEHFTKLWNYLPRCLYCNNFCTDDNQEVETECSPVNNRVCRCKAGSYGIDGFCLPHSECEPGYGVEIQGTLQKDTVCDACEEGFYSSSSSALEKCVKHQECAEGEMLLLPGSFYHNSVCGTCEQLAKGGQTLRTFLTGVFSMYRMRVVKMKRFVNRYINRSAPKHREPLLQLIKVWVAQAPEEQLRKLPDMLKESQLNSVAEKLQKRLEEIKHQSPNCNLNL